jgi:hypothetical protein
MAYSKRQREHGLVRADGQFGCALPDPDMEDMIAMDVAAGMPKASVIGQYDLDGPYTLARVLEKPRVARKVEGYRALAEQKTLTIFVKRKLAANDSLDQLIEYVKDAELTDPKAIGVRQWMVDGATQQRQYGESEPGGATVSMEVVVQLGDTTRELSAVIGRQVIDIEPDDQHLHHGTEFIARRERALAALGESSE